MHKAIFFDRDGTLIKTNISTRGTPISIKTKKEIKIYKFVKTILQRLKKKYLIFVITNQPDVGKKKNTKKNVDEINKFLLKKLPIKKIYTCYCSNNNCKYRKPKPGMIFKASKMYNIDLKKSYVVGDRWKDINAGYAAKCKTIFIDKKYNEKIIRKPTYILNNFKEISKIFKF